MRLSQCIELCDRIGNSLRQTDARLVTVESCTGGGIAQTITALAGSSDWFDRSLVTYSNQAKVDLARVDSMRISQFGAVSIEVAEAMAVGGLHTANKFNNRGAVWSIAVTGIAGPHGGSVAKPVGTVCFAWGLREQANVMVVKSERLQLPGNREAVRLASILHSLVILDRLLIN